MIVSALISQCRRQFLDIPESSQAKKMGDGSTVLFNTGKAPIIEGSYSVYVSGNLRTETTHYTLDLDSGDLSLTATPGSTSEVKVNFKTAFYRDKNWVEAINGGIESLNALGFFRQVVRDTTVLALSANVRTMSGPTNAIDVYEILRFDNRTVSGNYMHLPGNWSYQQDANKVILGWKPAVAEKLATSYLRNLQTYSATSATLDVLNDWIELVKLKSGAIFYRSLAAKIAKQGNASINEGHFSFTNLRTMANDLDADFRILAMRKKPTRPAKDLQYYLQ